jgi:hypothetical protein
MRRFGPPLASRPPGPDHVVGTPLSVRFAHSGRPPGVPVGNAQFSAVDVQFALRNQLRLSPLSVLASCE